MVSNVFHFCNFQISSFLLFFFKFYCIHKSKRSEFVILVTTLQYIIHKTSLPHFIFLFFYVKKYSIETFFHVSEMEIHKGFFYSKIIHFRISCVRINLCAYLELKMVHTSHKKEIDFSWKELLILYKLKKIAEFKILYWSALINIKSHLYRSEIL